VLASGLATGCTTGGATGGAAPPGPSLAPSAAAPISATKKVADSITSGTKKAFAWMTPKPTVTPAVDPTSLQAGTPKLRPDLCVSLARIYESKENYPAAAAQYEKALSIDANDLAALVGYGRLFDRQNQLNEATVYYERATKAHPQSARAWNDLGLCYARRGMYEQSVAALGRATAIEPDKKLFRNNLAAILVKLRREDEAIAQLAAVHDRATAHYNVGYLLAQSGNTQGALVHFQQAARHNPSMDAAHAWIAQLGGTSPAMASAASVGSQNVPVRHDQPRVEEAPYRHPAGDPNRYNEDRNREETSAPEPPHRAAMDNRSQFQPVRMPASERWTAEDAPSPYR
jgi:Tfp pilus assembly protein PilF